MDLSKQTALVNPVTRKFVSDGTWCTWPGTFSVEYREEQTLILWHRHHKSARSTYIQSLHTTYIYCLHSVIVYISDGNIRLDRFIPPILHHRLLPMFLSETNTLGTGDHILLLGGTYLVHILDPSALSQDAS